MPAPKQNPNGQGTPKVLAGMPCGCEHGHGPQIGVYVCDPFDAVFSCQRCNFWTRDPKEARSHALLTHVQETTRILRGIIKRLPAKA